MIKTTPPPTTSYPIPPPPFFTGALYDRIVLFLNKHDIPFSRIECVARGKSRKEALRDGPVVVIFVKGGEEGQVGALLAEHAAWVGVGVGGVRGEIVGVGDWEGE